MQDQTDTGANNDTIGAGQASDHAEPATLNPESNPSPEPSRPRRRRAASRAAGPPQPIASELHTSGAAAPEPPAPEPPAEERPVAASSATEPPAAQAPSNDAAASRPQTKRKRATKKQTVAAPGAAVLFQAPEFEPPPPTKEPPGQPESDAHKSKTRLAAGKEPAEGAADAAADQAGPDDDDDESTPKRRRRRRGGRGRKKRTDGDGDDAADDSADDDETVKGDTDKPKSDAAEPGGASDEFDTGDTAGSRRRRRRTRKGDTDERRPDDPPNTVVKVRDNRENSDDEVSSVKGSTRLEAKKQRRREGREAGRRRAPILSEAEFLARREAVDRVMAVRQVDDLTQIGVLEDGVLVEHYVSQASQSSLIGNVYVGRVQNVLPAMEAAFVDIGRGRNAVLYAGEVDWSDHENGDGPRRIEDVLKSGQSILVQVTKDPIGHKGARLTSQISLPGRYVVFVPGGSMSGISRKLPDTERTRLKKILKEVVPEDAGVIVRTAAEGASEEELTNDVARLRDQWEAIKKKSTGNAPALLQGEPDLAIKVVRDLFNEDFTKLVVSGDRVWGTIDEYVTTVAGSLSDRLEKWVKNEDVFDEYRVNEQIAKALDRKVWLPSGGSLVIDRTEAMTVIDVNTGKFTGSGGNLEETVTKNNLEAAEEVVRQLRLRDIGGIVVIDFIDMVLEANRDLVLRRLVECLGRDRTKHQVAEVTSLGLVQMTRKRIGTGLLEAFGEPCPHCRGRGVMIHDHPIEGGAIDGGSAGSSGGRSGRRGGRRRSGGKSDQAEPAESAESGEEHKPKLEASANPGDASPADLIPAESSAAPAES